MRGLAFHRSHRSLHPRPCHPYPPARGCVASSMGMSLHAQRPRDLTTKPQRSLAYILADRLFFAHGGRSRSCTSHRVGRARTRGPVAREACSHGHNFYNKTGIITWPDFSGEYHIEEDNQTRVTHITWSFCIQPHAECCIQVTAYSSSESESSISACPATSRG